MKEKKAKKIVMHTIKGKIQRNIMLVVGITLVILGSISALLTYRSSVSLLEETMTQMATIAAARVEWQLDALKNVAYETGSITRMSSNATLASEKKAIIDQKIEKYEFQSGDVVSSSGRSIFDGTDYSDTEWFQTAMGGEACITTPDVDPDTGALTIIIAAPLWEGGDVGGKTVGVVYFVTKETLLNDIVATIKVSPNSTTYLVDKNGTNIANVKMELVQSKSNSIKEAETNPDMASLAAVTAETIKGGTGFGQYSYGGVQKLLAYAPVPDTDGWCIGINAPISDFLSGTYQAIIVTLIILGVSLILAYFVSRQLALSISKPIKQCVDRIALIAKGDLKSPMPKITAKDETGLLAQATEEHLNALNTIISDIDYLIREIAGGNFDIRSKAIDSYVGDFASIVVTLRALVTELSSTMGQINSASDQVAAGAEQLASAATNLSQGATEQASSIEELAATVNEISVQTNQNAKSAAGAGSDVEALGAELRNSNEQMIQLIQAMNDIGTASNEISKIIKAIEDIAFQTNILALNAAVEAARAGAAGKGFAVVAEEVRNLAGKSAQAANSTTALIESAIRAVEEGTKLVDATGASLGHVVQRADNVVATVKTITEASVAQADAVNQVTMGIDQISGVVQMNSSAAEESAATSEELSSQSQLLKNLVSQFKLRAE